MSRTPTRPRTRIDVAAAQPAAAKDALALPELDYFREHFLPS